MTNKPEQVPDPSDAEVRLATENTFTGTREKEIARGRVALMKERIEYLRNSIARWVKALQDNACDADAQACLTRDKRDLVNAQARLKEAQIQSASKN